jgi:hypothetical protein
MIIAAIIFAIVLVPVLWVIFVPVNIKVNSANGTYEIKQTGTVTMSLHPGETPLIRMRVLGFLVDCQRKEKAGIRGKSRPAKAHRENLKSPDAWLSLFKGMVNSFRCRRFVCNIDFDDVVLNAQLFPVGYFMSRGLVVFNVNFERKYLLDIWLQARVHRMLWAFIRFNLTK